MDKTSGIEIQAGIRSCVVRPRRYRYGFTVYFLLETAKEEDGLRLSKGDIQLDINGYVFGKSISFKAIRSILMLLLMCIFIYI